MMEWDVSYALNQLSNTSNLTFFLRNLEKLGIINFKFVENIFEKIVSFRNIKVILITCYIN